MEVQDAKNALNAETTALGSDTVDKLFIDSLEVCILICILFPC